MVLSTAYCNAKGWFFFFQAEDGIRDGTVTGVQTCALPISSNIEVKCRVAGGSTILWIVDDGKIVEEGEEIVRLDTSAIDDKLNSQRITYEKALATFIQARGEVEAAKVAVQE